MAKIIEGLKEIKSLSKKAEDLRTRINKYHADYEHESAVYSDQKEKLQEWIQSHQDTIKRILQLKHAVKKTNINTPVAIEIAGNSVTHSISEWIDRRRELAGQEEALWKGINDRGLQEGTTQLSNGEKITKKIRRYYDPAMRDKKLDEYRDEPQLIDAALEVKNAVVDLIEA